MINKTLKPEELIQEWNEWGDLPQVPKLDVNDVEQMDYKSEFQNILNEMIKTSEITKKQYTNILTFQSRLVLFLSQKTIDIPNLLSRLLELRNLCIWKEN